MLKTCTVSFLANNGDTIPIETFTVNYSEAFSTITWSTYPNYPTLVAFVDGNPGYECVWLNVDGGSEWLSTTPITGNLVVYASWKTTLTWSVISFKDGNGLDLAFPAPGYVAQSGLNYTLTVPAGSLDAYGYFQIISPVVVSSSSSILDYAKLYCNGYVLSTSLNATETSLGSGIFEIDLTSITDIDLTNDGPFTLELYDSSNILIGTIIITI